MSVLKSKRKKYQFEVFHHLNKMRREITDLLLRDFGYSFEKAEKKLNRKFGGRSYDELSDVEKEHYNLLTKRYEKFDWWFVEDERKVIIECLRDITKEVYIANSIYPTCWEELVQRRIHQDEAIGHCYRLVQELQYVMETLPVDVNKFLPFGESIQTEINLIKGWRKSDNKFKSALKQRGQGTENTYALEDKRVSDNRAISDSASNFANVNNNGNANNNNASNSNGVRPDFGSIV